VISLWKSTAWFASLSVGDATQVNTVKPLRVRHGRVVMAAPALTSSPVTTALVRQLTPAATAPLRTASPTTRVVTVVVVTALGSVTAHLATQVISSGQLLNSCQYLR